MGKLTGDFIRLILSIIILFIGQGKLFSQTYSSHVANYIKKVEHPYSFLLKCEQLGIKVAGTKALDSTCNWLLKLISDEGYTVNSQEFLFNNDTLRNLEFIKKGSSDSSIILCAHYDSWVGPGVNDNGTGDFAIYQFAKLIKPLKTKYTIRFIYFSGEEPHPGFLGSKHYVRLLNKDSVKLKFMINFDQLGGTIGEDNSAIKCEADNVSTKQAESNTIAQIMANCYNLYTNLTGIISPAYSSDYLPFRDSGYVIAGIYQNSPFPYYHSENDLLTHIEFNSLVSTVKGALAAILYFSEAEVPLSGVNKNNITRNVTVYNTRNELVMVNSEGYFLVLYDQLGRQIFSQNNSSKECKIDLSSYHAGIYYAYLRSGENVVCKKFLIYP